MLTQRFGESKIHFRKTCRQSLPRRSEIAANVNSRGKEVGQEYNALGSCRDATRPSVVNIRLGPLQKRCNDRNVLAALPDFLGKVVQVGVGFCLPASVRDQK
jgi:hypothetical protein